MAAQQLTLDEAVAEIRRTCEAHRGKYPFFFMTGAGLSYPVVPLAGDIISHCRARIGVPETGAENGMDAYSRAFLAAYPSPKDRQEYLHGLIDGKPVSTAGYQLARLLAARVISNLLVTVNFDDFVSRALALLGESHLVFDSPSLTDRIDVNGDMLQLVHVHGSYRFYDCRNSAAEIRKQAKSPMGRFLEKVLDARSPIIIGYSGWDQDVFLANLLRRLKRDVPFNVYWFCFSQAASTNLRRALLNHSNVKLVVPETTGGILKADFVLTRFVQAFGLEGAPLVDNPFDHFAQIVNQNLPSDDPGIAHVVDLLRCAGRFPLDWYGTVDYLMHLLQESVGRLRYDIALRAGSELTSKQLAAEQSERAFECLWTAAEALRTKEAWQLAMEMGKKMESSQMLPVLAQARLVQAKIHCLAAEPGQTFAKLVNVPEVARAAARSPFPEVRQAAVKALERNADLLGSQWADVTISEFGSDTDDVVRQYVAQAICHRIRVAIQSAEGAWDADRLSTPALLNVLRENHSKLQSLQTLHPDNQAIASLLGQAAHLVTHYENQKY